MPGDVTISTSTKHEEYAAARVRTPRTAWTIAWCHTGDSGGSKRAAFEMVRELSRRGHIIDEYIIRVGEPNLSHWPLQPFVRKSYSHLLPPGGNQLRPHLLHLWAGLIQEWWQRNQLTKILRTLSSDLLTRQYDFVHLDHCSPSYTVPLTAMVSLPTVVYSHEVSGARYEGPAGTNTTASGLRRLYQQGCDAASQAWGGMRTRADLHGLAHAQLVLTNSYYSKEAMFQRTRRHCSVCRYGVDTATFQHLGLTRENMILSAGRLVEAKQHHLVIEAVSRMPGERRPRVVIATPEALTHQEDPAYAQKVVTMAQDARVILEIRRNPSEAQLVELYNRALMLVFVPIMEPFGLVALEAMACGTPVVGIREGGIRESVQDGLCGILVDRDVQDLSNAITTLVENRELRNQYGQAAADYVRKEWTWGNSIDRYESEVSRLLGRFHERIH